MQNSQMGSYFPVPEIGSSDDFASLLLPGQAPPLIQPQSLSPPRQAMSVIPPSHTQTINQPVAVVQNQETRSDLPRPISSTSSNTTINNTPTGQIISNYIAPIPDTLKPPPQSLYTPKPADHRQPITQVSLPSVLANVTKTEQAPSSPEVTATPLEDIQPTTITGPIMVGGKILHEETVAGKLASFISLGLVFYGSWYLILTLLSIYLFELGNQAATGFEERGITGQFLLAYPMTGLVIGTYAISTVLYFIAAIRNTMLTTKAWTLSFVAVIIGILAALFASLTHEMGVADGITHLESVIVRYYPGLPYPELWQVIAYGGLISIFLIPLLVLAKRDYKPDSKNDHSKFWVAYGLLGMGTVCLVTAYLVYQAMGVLDKNYGLKELDRTVSYHVYHAATAPGARTPKTRFGINTDKSSLMVGRDDFVEIIYDYPLLKRITLKTDGEMTLRQIQVGQPFDLQAFSSSLLSGATVESIRVSTADLEQAYSITSTSGKRLSALAMLTPDSVLILLSSPTAEVSELISMAESLK